MTLTAATGPTSNAEELREAIVEGRISMDQAIRAILDSRSFQAPPPSTQLVLDRLAILQSTIEAQLEAAFRRRSERVEARSTLLLLFLQNWQLFALFAFITSVETACLTYLLAR